MTKGWFKRWWTMALLAVGLAGIVIYDVWRVVRILAEPVVDWWGLLGPCLGGIWLALLAAQAARRAVSLYRAARPVGGEAQVGH
ncbi:hypothetical protein JL475_29890 [Streptomyces sp. M2CJ-2]|uniref:hypothetical protein n=1 Tax=Streptomyces sp. M2CJ-2 TaxID=2803948 RepID=UPI001928BE05|nr:hypothetical protein [Streptomyces sp. M2CJ-2]MBL3670118.1 hypothetical protein [Streptomyces sp. M2CJ-2]